MSAGSHNLLFSTLFCVSRNISHFLIFSAAESHYLRYKTNVLSILFLILFLMLPLFESPDILGRWPRTFWIFNRVTQSILGLRLRKFWDCLRYPEHFGMVTQEILGLLCNTLMPCWLECIWYYLDFRQCTYFFSTSVRTFALMERFLKVQLQMLHPIMISLAQ